VKRDTYKSARGPAERSDRMEGFAVSLEKCRFFELKWSPDA
jgi:hypothetical protein